MEIKGLGNSFIPLTQEKAFQSKEPSFQKVLDKVINSKSTKQNSNPNEDKKEIKDAKAILSFLKKSDLDGIASEKQEDRKSSDPLQSVKNLLGISDQKWSEIVAELEALTNEKLKDQSPINMIIDGLSFLTMNPLKEGFSDNMILFLKAAKGYNLLANLDRSGQKLLTGLLDSVQEQLQDFIQNGQAQSKRTYIENTFSQLISEMKEQTTGNEQTNQLKAVNRLTDWNANGPFFQQMSKPEQLEIMMNGAAKSVSVDDLIQQFESILSKSQFSKMGGVQKLFFKLNPEHLGSISIELIRKDQAITARIITATEAAKEALESHVHNLKHAFEAQSIKVDNIEIGQSEVQQDDYFNNSQSGQQEYPQEQGSQKDEHEEPADSFILTLEEAILNQEA